jgi:hypothetical protein
MLDLSQPHALEDIVKSVSDKTVIGSALRTAEWSVMPKALRDQAYFSAGVTQAEFLARQRDLITKVLARAKETNDKGENYWASDRAYFISQTRQLGKALGVQHPAGPRKGDIVEGDITDPLSLARLKLIYDTQLELAYGRADYLTSMDVDLLAAFPAWELVRVSQREEPRDWPTRWNDAAVAVGWDGVSREATASGRLIALKTSGIWLALSRFGKPHPPFDFNSGMGVEDIDRNEVEDLGLMDAETVQASTVADYEAQMQASIMSLGTAEKAALKKVFGDRINLGPDKVTWAPEDKQLKTAAAVAIKPAKATPAELIAVAGGTRTDGKPLRFKPDLVPLPKAGKGLMKQPRKPTAEEVALINLQDERAVGYDDKGAVLGFIDGLPAEVTPPDDWLKPGYTLTHNHPRGTSFSGPDLVSSVYSGLKEVRAIGHQGQGRSFLYRMQFEGMTQAQATDVDREYKKISKKLLNDLGAKINAGVITKDEVFRSFSHWVMLKMVAVFSQMKYERIKL